MLDFIAHHPLIDFAALALAAFLLSRIVVMFVAVVMTLRYGAFRGQVISRLEVTAMFVIALTVMTTALLYVVLP